MVRIRRRHEAGADPGPKDLNESPPLKSFVFLVFRSVYYSSAPERGAWM
jgi:hypothetical protein